MSSGLIEGYKQVSFIRVGAKLININTVGSGEAWGMLPPAVTLTTGVTAGQCHSSEKERERKVIYKFCIL